MKRIDREDIRKRIELVNPWWASKPIPEASFPHRVYYGPFASLALNFSVRRAAILLGPRRVGKTVMVKQLIAHACQSKRIDPRAILYASIDSPVFSGIELEQYLDYAPTLPEGTQRIVIFDEIQYLRDWELHLKQLVDTYPGVKFVATGSAAAALRLKSKESGAGRFSEFMLPPLTFYEFLKFIGDDEKLIEVQDKRYVAKNINELNKRFVDYLNFGGYPEAVLNEEIRRNSEQFIRQDIIDKVLLKDLPSLYGIDSIPELNKLFAFLAYNAGSEASYEKIASQSGVPKQTIRKYLEYLQSAFLILKVSTVDQTCRSMQRERNFKVYLNNPSIRAALFSPVEPDDSDRIGHLAESAVFSQWQHAAGFRNLRYARWKGGEVDIVYLSPGEEKPAWVCEIKWSDGVTANVYKETRHVHTLLKSHRTIEKARFTTKTVEMSLKMEGRVIDFTPTALYCYTVGRNITDRLDVLMEDEAPG